MSTSTGRKKSHLSIIKTSKIASANTTNTLESILGPAGLKDAMLAGDHPAAYGHRLEVKHRSGNRMGLYNYRDLAEALNVRKGTLQAAVYKHQKIFFPCDAIVHRPPHRSVPMWRKERFIEMWKLYKSLHP